MNLDKRKVLILGGTSGFGLCVARFAGLAGAEVSIVGRDEKKMSAAVTSLQIEGVTVKGHLADVTDGKVLDSLLATEGTFDHLVSLVGGFMGGGFLDASEEIIRKAIEEKFFANLGIARRAAPYLRDQGSMVFTAGSGGRPDNASGAFVGNESVRTLVQGLAVEIAPRGRVNAVAPTWTRTPLWRNMPDDQVDATERQFAKEIPLGRVATIAEVASVYIFLMENTFITGQTITVDGGLTPVS